MGVTKGNVELNPRNAWDKIMLSHLEGEGAHEWRVLGRRRSGASACYYVVQVGWWDQGTAFENATDMACSFLVAWNRGTTGRVTHLLAGTLHQTTYYNLA